MYHAVLFRSTSIPIYTTTEIGPDDVGEKILLDLVRIRSKVNE